MTREEAKWRLADHFRVHNDGVPTPKLDEAVTIMFKALQEPERKHGRWIEYENEYGEKLHYCSECKKNAHRHYSEYRNDVVELLFDYCQHCGADMRGK